MKCWKGPECKIRLKDPDTRRQLRLKVGRTSEGINRKAFGLEFVKKETGMFSRLRKVRLDSVEGLVSSRARKQGSDIVEGLTPSKTEEPTSTVNVRGAKNVGAPATWYNFAPPFKKKTVG
jgi:hypothetical protein